MNARKCSAGFSAHILNVPYQGVKLGLKVFGEAHFSALLGFILTLGLRSSSSLLIDPEEGQV